MSGAVRDEPVRKVHRSLRVLPQLFTRLVDACSGDVVLVRIAVWILRCPRFRVEILVGNPDAKTVGARATNSPATLASILSEQRHRESGARTEQTVHDRATCVCGSRLPVGSRVGLADERDADDTEDRHDDEESFRHELPPF
jgi:hypothetical protein